MSHDRLSEIPGDMEVDEARPAIEAIGGNSGERDADHAEVCRGTDPQRIDTRNTVYANRWSYLNGLSAVNGPNRISFLQQETEWQTSRGTMIADFSYLRDGIAHVELLQTIPDLSDAWFMRRAWCAANPGGVHISIDPRTGRELGRRCEGEARRRAA